MGKIRNDIPMYTAWVHEVGFGQKCEIEPQGVEYGAVNSKAAACLHARRSGYGDDDGAWPLVVRVRCPSGELHQITVKRVVEYDYQPAIVEQVEPPRRK